MKTSELAYAADGVGMVGYLVRPAASPRPAVVIFPDAMGLSEGSRERAEQIAEELGVVALASDLWGGGRTPAAPQEAMALVRDLKGNQQAMRTRAVAALQALQELPCVDCDRVAAIGFCVGGTMAFELALTGARIQAAVGFHSGLRLSAPEEAHNVGAALLAIVGADDPSITAEDRAAFESMFRGSGVDWQLHILGGNVHAFTDKRASDIGRPDFARYDAQAESRSWNAMKAFVAEKLAL